VGRLLFTKIYQNVIIADKMSGSAENERVVRKVVPIVDCGGGPISEPKIWIGIGVGEALSSFVDRITERTDLPQEEVYASFFKRGAEITAELLLGHEIVARNPQSGAERILYEAPQDASDSA
jgi:hypothetical protein